MPPPSTEKIRAAILDAALPTFLQSGFGASSMEVIALKADLVRRTVFNQFATMEALFKAAVNLLWARLPQEEILADEELLNYPGRGLRRIADVTLEFWTNHESVDLLKLVICESVRFPFLLETYRDRGRLPAYHHMIAYLDVVKARGHLQVENTKLATHQFIGLSKNRWSDLGSKA